MTPADDHRWMARAMTLARRGLYTTDPNPRVGCVVVAGGREAGSSWHARAGGAHAEVGALEAAGTRARGASAFVTLEPCCHRGRTGPCVERLIAAGVRRVVAAARDPNPAVAGGGLAALAAAGIETAEGALESRTRALNPGFFSRHERGRPWVRLKLAASLDGRTALASGESRWITGPDARRDVQRWRARSSAILTGIGTVLADDPRLTVRPEALGERDPYPPAPVRQPLRVVLDPGLRTPPDARVVAGPGRALIFAAPGADEPGARGLAAAEIMPMETTDGRIDLAGVLVALAAREVNEVLVECGATLAGALLDADLVDELILYLAPSILGDGARALFALAPIERMADRRDLSIVDTRMVGPDLRILVRPGASRWPRRDAEL